MDPNESNAPSPAPSPPAPTEADLEAAFASGFADEPGSNAPAPAPAPEPAPGPASAAPTPGPSPAPAADVDPWADLPEAARKELARIPVLEHESKSNRGRVKGLTDELLRLRQAGAPASAPATAPGPPAQIESLERVRGEMPEVAQAIEDAVRIKLAGAAPAAPAPGPAAPAPSPSPAAAPSPAPAPGSAQMSEDESILAEEYPGWETKLMSTDFQLWLGRQAEDYRSRVMSTDKAGVLMGAFNRFDKTGKVTAPPPGPPAPAPNSGDGLAERRAARASAAVQPRGAAVRSPTQPHQQTDEEAFESGFKGS